MEEMISVDSLKLVDAVRIWSGWGQCSSPCRDESRLKVRLGVVDADNMLPTIKKLEVDFYATDAHLKARDLVELGKLAKEHFRRLYPNVSEEISNILEWCYTFDFR